MIHLTRLDGTDLVVNSDLISTVEATPDSVVNLINGSRIIVREGIEEIVDRIVAFRHRAGREVRVVHTVADKSDAASEG